MKNSKNFAIRWSFNTVTSKSVFYLLQVDTEAALIRMGKNSFSVNVCYSPFLRLRTRLGQLCVRLWSHSAVQHNSEQPTSKHCKTLVLVISFSSLITKQHCLSLIWISFSHVTVLYLCRFSSTSFKWTAFLVHVVRISFKKFLKVRLLDLVLGN